MKKWFLLCLLLVGLAADIQAQRKTDKLDRGLVAVPHFSSINYGSGINNSQNGILVSWRILPEEYYDVTYNVYRDGTKVNSTPLTVSNFVDTGGSTSSEYQVRAVVRGVEQDICTAVTPWIQLSNNYNQPYKKIELADVYDRNGNDVTDHYWANDAEFADLDGDGQLEMIIKRLNTVDAAAVYPITNTTEFVVIDAYDIDWKYYTASLLWRIDCGPNMVSLNSTEINIVAFDWDEDGKAEVVLRGADNMIVYGSTGQNQLYTIGDMNVNTRNTFDPDNGAQYAWTHTGAEYLIYMNGEKGTQYQITEYPLKRLEYQSTLSAEWGGKGYGHNSSKYFFGAPYLDGHTPSLFMARGIYGSHKMIAMNLNKGTHQWSERWRWNCMNSSSPWWGNGYHNFVIADVDEDGRDEIVYGSMVIDDNGKGLHTTGYQHGDAQHVSDFNPYRKGLEIFACLEDEPYWGNNYRDGTTGEVLFKYSTPVSGGKEGDDGRCIMGNFRADIPGCIGTSSQMMNRNGTVINSLTGKEISGSSGWIDANVLNFRLYWDGDLLDEEYTGTGANDNGSWAKIIKQSGPNGTGSGNTRLFTSGIGTTNNGSKNNACFIGDILGDWREEIVMRDGTDIVIFTTPIASDYGFYTLWADHEYRQAMVWQMMAYNQPPHKSFFLGELEGITIAPPPLTTEGRTVIANGTNINSAYNGQHLLHNEYANTTLAVGDGVPHILTVNVPEVKSGTDVNGQTGVKVKTDGSVGNSSPSPINTTTYTCTLTGGGFSGDMRLVKQGNGILDMASANHTYTGDTKVWGGTLNFNGMMQNSHVWMNRHTTLASDGGKFQNGVELLYGAQLSVTNTVEVNELTMDFGSRLVLNMNNNALLNAGKLILQSKVGESVWENYGPEYLSPVIQITLSERLEPGRYVLAHYDELEGSLDNVVLETEGINEKYAVLGYDDNEIYVDISAYDDVKEPTIAITDMAEYTKRTDLYPSTGDYKYYLPVVSVATEDIDGKTPKLSGSFTNLLGYKTEFEGAEGEVLFSEDFESYSDEGTATQNWRLSSDFATINWLTDATHAHYLNLNCNGGGGNRTMGRNFGLNSNTDQYTIEFDASIKVNNNSNGNNEIVLFGQGASLPSSNRIFDGNNFIFKISGGKNKNTSYSIAHAVIDGSTNNESVTLNSEKWYHYQISVNKPERKVNFTLKDGSTIVKSINYNITDGNVNMALQGIVLSVGRYDGQISIDNIVIKTEGTDLSSYTFTEPGTLEITASLGEDSGYEPSTTTFEMLNPYFPISEAGYYENYDDKTDVSPWTSPNASDKLKLVTDNGNKYISFDFSTDVTTNSRSASMPFNLTMSDDVMYTIGFDASIKYGTNQQTGLTVLSNGTISDNNIYNTANGGFLFDIVNQAGNSNVYTVNGSDTKVTIPSGTWCHYSIFVNTANRTTKWTIINKDTDKEIGSGVFILPSATSTTPKNLFIREGRYYACMNIDNVSIIPYLPVSLNDELCSALLPQVIENGSAHVYRSSLSGDSWASMVVPFDMTASQVKETFGEDVVIGNLNPYYNEPEKVYFETETGAVKANVPFLIKGVTKTTPYLIMGITSSPVEIPVLSTPNFDYIGTYLNKGLTPFTTSDYFFMANSDKLKQVASDGMKMTVKGYRAWFHSNTGAQHSISVSFSDHQFPDEEPLAEDFGNQDVTSVLSLEDASRLSGDWYNLLGQKMTGHPMRRGVYIVNGRRVIIK